MTAKHKPATAPVGCPNVSCEDVNRLIEERNKARDDRALLVAALRKALIESDRTMATGSRDIMDWQDDNRTQGDRIRALLRELGESE